MIAVIPAWPRAACGACLLSLFLAAPAAAEGASWQRDWDATVAAANQEGALVVSAPSGRDWRDALMEFQKAYPQIKLDMTPAASRDFWPRIVKEHEAGQYLWDLRIGGVDAPSYDLKNKGELAPVRPLLMLPEVVDDKAWAAGLDGLFLDKEKQYFPAFVAYESQSVYYNKAKIADGAALTIAEPRRSEMGRQDLDGRSARRRGAQHPDRDRQALWRRADQEADEQSAGHHQRAAPADGLAGLGPLSHRLRHAEHHAGRIRPARRAVDDFAKVPGLKIWSPGVGAIQLLVKQPHPNAAKVFINWLLTRDVQAKLMQAVRLDSQRVDVPPGDPATALAAGAMGQYICTQSEDLEPFEQHVVVLLRGILP